MPMVPASGDDEQPEKYRTRHSSKPVTEAQTAPVLFAFVLTSPQINGPRNTDPMAPQEIPRMDTIVAGLK